MAVAQLSPSPARPIGSRTSNTPSYSPARNTSGSLAAFTDVPHQQSPVQDPAMGGMSVKLAAARQAAYPDRLPVEQELPKKGGFSMVMLLGLGLLIFAFCFAIGYFIAQALP
jgi:hypothetical protein